MEYDYDEETDVLLIRLREGEPDHGEQEGDVITHYGSDGRPIQLEILDASSNAVGMLRAILGSRAEA